MSGHDLSVLSGMSAANRGLRSRAATMQKRFFLAPQARAQLPPASPLLACWDAMQRSAHFKKLTARFIFFVSHISPSKALDNLNAISDTDARMNRFSTREAAKKLGISYETLAHYIAVGKVAPPEIAKVGKRVIHMWADAEIEHVRQLLPKIANGRKTRYQKLKQKQKPQPRAAVPHKPRKPKKKQ